MPGYRTIYTIGHSNRTIEDFIALLEENKIELLADVRSIPMSGHNPQFNKNALDTSLHYHGIEYTHIAALGGRRGRTNKASDNMGWQHSSFRNFADYAETEPFRKGLEELTQLARKRHTCYMCAEAVWWRCHRRIITDYLLVQQWNVKHIMAPGKATSAEMNENALVQKDGRILYPAAQEELGLH